MSNQAYVDEAIRRGIFDDPNDANAKAVRKDLEGKGYSFAALDERNSVEDWRTFQIKYPDQAERADKVYDLQTFDRQAIQSLPGVKELGAFGSAAVSAAGAAFDADRDIGPTFSDTYDQELHLLRAVEDRYRQENPVKSVGADVTGALVTGAGVTGLARAAAPKTAAALLGPVAGRGVLPYAGRVAQAAAVGGVTEGVRGFAQGQGGAEKRLDNAAEYGGTAAKFGAGFAAAAPVVQPVARLAGRALTGAYNAAGRPLDKASDRAIKLFLQGLDDAGMTVDDLVQRVKRGILPMDTSDPMQRLAGSARRAPGTQGQRLVDTLNRRASQQGRRMREGFADAAGVPKIGRAVEAADDFRTRNETVRDYLAERKYRHGRGLALQGDRAAKARRLEEEAGGLGLTRDATRAERADGLRDYVRSGVRRDPTRIRPDLSDKLSRNDLIAEAKKVGIAYSNKTDRQLLDELSAYADDARGVMTQSAYDDAIGQRDAALRTAETRSAAFEKRMNPQKPGRYQTGSIANNDAGRAREMARRLATQEAPDLGERYLRDIADEVNAAIAQGGDVDVGRIVDRHVLRSALSDMQAMSKRKGVGDSLLTEAEDLAGWFERSGAAGDPYFKREAGRLTGLFRKLSGRAAPPVPQPARIISDETAPYPAGRVQSIKIAAQDKADSLYQSGNRRMSRRYGIAAREARELLHSATLRSGYAPYKEGDRVFARHQKIIDAVDEGRNFFKTTPEEVTRVMRDMTDEQAKAYRVGAVRGFFDKIETRGGRSNLLSSIDDEAAVMDARLRALFRGDDEALQAVKDVMAREATMAQTRTAVLGNSATQGRAMDDAYFEEMAGGPSTGNYLGDLVRFGWRRVVGDALGDKLNHLPDRVRIGITRRVADRLATLLSEDDTAKLTREIQEYLAQQGQRKALALPAPSAANLGRAAGAAENR